MRLNQTSDRYKVFIGGWVEKDEPDWITFKADNLTWSEAQNKLAEKLAAYRDDNCDVCRDQAKEELTRFMAAEPGRFEAEVEGDDYMIMEDDKS